VENNKQKLFISTDAGGTWNIQDTVPPQTSRISFVDNETGFCVSGFNIYKTTNKGINWIQSFNNSQNLPIADFSFQDLNKGLILTGVKVFKTTNGGNNWAEISSLPAYQFKEITYQKNSQIVLLEPSTSIARFWSSTDDGAAFTYYQINFPMTSGGYHSSFRNLGLGLLSADAPRLYLINNLNHTYQNANLAGPLYENLKDMHVFNSDEVIIAGDSNLIRTSNSGANWIKYPGVKFNEIEFLNYYTGYAINSNTLFKTTNHGVNWSIIPTRPGTAGTFSDLYLKGNETICLVGDSIGGTGQFMQYVHRLYLTTNEGIEWSTKFSSGGGASYFSSNDTWIEGYTFLNANTGYLINNFSASDQTSRSSNGKLKKTINNGIDWVDVFYKDSCYLRSVFFLNENTGYIMRRTVFNNPTSAGFSRTTNAGQTWEAISSFTSEWFQLTNEYTVYSPGYASSDGGYNWVHQFDPFTPNGIKFINNLTGYIFGDNGTLYKTTNGGGIVLGVNITSNNIPDKISLHQNYPNPFNPSTRINYELRNSNYVTLKVFDLLGKEVATLVNEKQNAGSYAVDFNSAEFNLPSGIYFYTLNADEFKETRKMVLVK
jgi:photosystem II stability/assembly factor-like uncharacterized protein